MGASESMPSPFDSDELRERLKYKNLIEILGTFYEKEEAGLSHQCPEAWFFLTYNFLFYTLMREHTVNNVTRDFFRLTTEEKLLDGFGDLKEKNFSTLSEYIMKKALEKAWKLDKDKGVYVPSPSAPIPPLLDQIFKQHYKKINKTLRTILAAEYGSFILPEQDSLERVKNYLRMLPKQTDWKKIVEFLQKQYPSILSTPY